MSSCDVALLIIGPACAAAGIFALALAVALWARPESRFARAALEPWRPFDVVDLAPPLRSTTRYATMQLTIGRTIFPIVGSAFLAVGCYLTSTIVRCETSGNPYAGGAVVAALSIVLLFALVISVRSVLRRL